jgi:ABC-type multidrug transport system fused ATPase/permease subunit
MRAMGADADRAAKPLVQAPAAARERRARANAALFPTARKTLQLLSRRERWTLAALVGAMIFSGILQAAGVASITPFIALAANPNLVVENELLARVYDGLGFETPRRFLLFLGAVVFVVIAAANAFMALTTWATLRFVAATQHRLSQQLVADYLAKPYAFFLGRNTARLSKTLLSEVKEVIRSIVVPGMDVLSRAIAAAFIIALLLVVDPALAVLVATTLSGLYALVYVVVRRRQRALGDRRVAAQTARYKAASEAFGGIKDVKVLGREAHFVQRFRDASREYSRVNASSAAVAELPRFGLETMAFGGILVIVLYLVQTRETLAEVLPLLALYAAAGYRLMPALQHVFLGLNRIRFHTPALDDLHADLLGWEDRSSPAEVGTEDISPAAPLRVEHEIRFRDVSFAYPGSRGFALRGIDLVVPAGQMVGLVGTTGSGKTTVADLLLGLFEPTEGSILVDGVPLDESTVGAWRSQVGYVPQSIYLGDDSVTRNVAYGVPDDEIDQDAVERAVRAAHLEHFVEALPDGYDTVVGERGVRLSGGERQRLGIARALYHDPALLVLDEATSALDTATEEAVMRAIHELRAQRTLMIIAHRLTTVRACDTIYVLEAGGVAARGTYDDLATTSPSFRALARIS